MTLRRLPLDALQAHPENANRMPDRLLAKLRRHIERTGLYEPLVVRPVPADRSRQAFQILNGHHRATVLRELGHTRARCDVWDVGDEEARLLLATLNRLEGRDDPSARAALVARLAAARSADELAALLPEPPDAVERLLAISEPPPEPVHPEALAPPLRPMTFFLTEEQHELVAEALREIGRVGRRAQATGRAGRLERLARWYLESIDRL